jgi:hypothetical protein
MDIKSIRKTEDTRLPETQETTECQNAVSILPGNPEMIECTVVLRPTMIGRVHHGIQTSGRGTIGDRERRNVEVR